MTLLSDYTAGTVSSSGLVITGTGTAWQTAQFREGDVFIAEGWWMIVASVDSETQITLRANSGVQGAPLTDAPYRLRYMSDGSRASAQARQLIDLLGGSGNIEALAGLAGAADLVPMFTGAGTMTVVPKIDLVSGVNYDVQVDTLADRDAYDTRPEDFSVLVSDMGDGRSAIFSRVGAAGNWSDPAYVTGPVGPLPTIQIGDTTTGAPGTDADVTATPITGGVELDFTIPAGEGFAFAGQYDSGTAYVKGDVVRDNNSSWIALQATTGNAPPVYPTTSNSYWALLAAKGQDGLGTGDVVGPASATDSNVALFDGTTGKLIKDGFPTTALGRNLINSNSAAAARGTLQVGGGNNLVFTVDGVGTKFAGSGKIYDAVGAATVMLLENDRFVSYDGAATTQLFDYKKTDSTPTWKGSGLYHRGNAVGSVSRSGGVPTNALMEIGDNANGTYLRFANNFQVSIGRWSATTGNGTTATFAASFASPPDVLALARSMLSSGNNGSYVIETASINESTCKVKYLIHLGSSLSTGDPVTCSVIAFGKWY